LPRKEKKRLDGLVEEFPFSSTPLRSGCFDVDAMKICDVDEFAVYLTSTQRNRGRSPRGVRVVVRSKLIQGTSSRVLAVSPECGYVTSLLFKGALTREWWELFFRQFLLPSLPGHGRVVMFDNCGPHSWSPKRRACGASKATVYP